MTPTPWEFALLSLAAFRIWKLLKDDAILDGPRNAVLDRLSNRSAERLVYFLSCPWCLGAWISLALYTGWVAVGPGVWGADQLWMAMLSVLAISAVVGMLGELLERL